jgi:hypothetical protein
MEKAVDICAIVTGSTRSFDERSFAPAPPQIRSDAQWVPICPAHGGSAIDCGTIALDVLSPVHCEIGTIMRPFQKGGTGDRCLYAPRPWSNPVRVRREFDRTAGRFRREFSIAA